MWTNETIITAAQKYADSEAVCDRIMESPYGKWDIRRAFIEGAKFIIKNTQK